MSDTPRTDAAIYPLDIGDVVWPEFSRQLERELNAANERIKRLEEESESRWKLAEAAVSSCSELEERIKRLEEVAAKLANCARFLGTWNHDSMDVLRMKDEAMDELQNLEKEKP